MIVGEKDAAAAAKVVKTFAAEFKKPTLKTGVIDRLETRGLMQRNASAQDRRVRLLTLTAAGGALLAALVPAMLQAQQRILSPLPEAERGEFMRMLAVLIAGHRTVEDTPGAG